MKQTTEAEIITIADAVRWLDGYKRAWEMRDPDLAVQLFTSDVAYREKRSEPPLDLSGIRSYWQTQVREWQRDPSYDYEIWGMVGNACIVHWWARFEWLPINGVVDIDAVSRVVLDRQADGALLCSRYEEWLDVRQF